jgi:hypothetical protein
MKLRHDYGGNERNNQRQVGVEGITILPRTCMTAELQVLLWPRCTMVALYTHQFQTFPGQTSLLLTSGVYRPSECDEFGYLS